MSTFEEKKEKFERQVAMKRDPKSKKQSKSRSISKDLRLKGLDSDERLTI